MSWPFSIWQALHCTSRNLSAPWKTVVGTEGWDMSWTYDCAFKMNALNCRTGKHLLSGEKNFPQIPWVLGYFKNLTLNDWIVAIITIGMWAQFWHLSLTIHTDLPSLGKRRIKIMRSLKRDPNILSKIVWFHLHMRSLVTYIIRIEESYLK